MSTVRMDPLGGFECTVGEFRQRYGGSGEPERAPFPHDDRRCPIYVCAGDTVRFGPALFTKNGLVLRAVKLTLEDSDESRFCVAVYGYQEGPKRQLADGSWSVRVTPFTGVGTEEEQHVLDALRITELTPDSFVACDVVRLMDLGEGMVDWFSCDPLIDFLEMTTEEGEC